MLWGHYWRCSVNCVVTGLKPESFVARPPPTQSFLSPVPVVCYGCGAGVSDGLRGLAQTPREHRGMSRPRPGLSVASCPFSQVRSQSLWLDCWLWASLPSYSPSPCSSASFVPESSSPEGTGRSQASVKKHVAPGPGAPRSVPRSSWRGFLSSLGPLFSLSCQLPSHSQLWALWVPGMEQAPQKCWKDSAEEKEQESKPDKGGSEVGRWAGASPSPWNVSWLSSAAPHPKHTSCPPKPHLPQLCQTGPLDCTFFSQDCCSDLEDQGETELPQPGPQEPGAGAPHGPAAGFLLIQHPRCPGQSASLQTKAVSLRPLPPASLWFGLERREKAADPLRDFWFPFEIYIILCKSPRFGLPSRAAGPAQPAGAGCGEGCSMRQKSSGVPGLSG